MLCVSNPSFTLVGGMEHNIDRHICAHSSACYIHSVQKFRTGIQCILMTAASKLLSATAVARLQVELASCGIA